VQSYETRVVNPTTGARLAVSVSLPGANERRSAVVLVPGELSSGRLFFGAPAIATRFAKAGYVAVHFDADGRGQSEGQEDYNGHAQQDGLAAILRETAGLPEVNAARIAVASFGFGLSLALGAVVRQPDPAVQLLIDWEGIARRPRIASLLGQHGLLVEDDTAEAWWNERDPLLFAPQLRVPYQRVQSTGSGSAEDMLLLIERTTSTAHGGRGGSRYTRVNGNLPNRVYRHDHLPWLLDSVPPELAVLSYLLELLPAGRG
jgi:pimeloyl-ACP methyl ester carboxylesterase